MATLIAKDIMKNFNGTPVLKGVSLTVQQGEFISIVGASGSGKSTLLSILGGIDKPDSGTVTLGDTEISKGPEKELAKLRRTRIGFVFQFFNLAPYLTVEENILLPLVMDGKRTKDYREKLDELTEYLGISEYRHRMPRKLSGGDQQRVAIARGLIFAPEIILLDEPTGNLDSVNGKEIMELLKKINEEKGTTIIQVTHSDANAAYANRIVTMQDGYLKGSVQVEKEATDNALSDGTEEQTTEATQE